MPKLSQQELESYLWGAAVILRGKTAGQDYKTYILTLLFFKRLSDQWDYEADDVIREKEAEFGRTLNEKQRQALRATAHVHRFNIPEGAHWNDVLTVSENIGEAHCTRHQQRQVTFSMLALERTYRTKGVGTSEMN
jgi:type I restriction enzyme M protein